MPQDLCPFSTQIGDSSLFHETSPVLPKLMRTLLSFSIKSGTHIIMIRTDSTLKNLLYSISAI